MTNFSGVQVQLRFGTLVSNWDYGEDYPVKTLIFR